MAEPRGVLSFSQNGYYLDRKEDYNWLEIPEDLKTELAQTKKNVIHCMAFGENDDYFCTWKAKGHIRSKERVLYSLDHYPQLKDYISDITAAKDIDLTTFHVNLGPNGSFYVNSNRGQFHNALDGKLESELNRRMSSDGTYASDPAHVSLGVDGSYVLLGSKGDIMWDLKGHYGDLDGNLMNAKFGVRNVILSPYDSDQFYVIYKDGTPQWKTTHDDWRFSIE